MTTASDLTSLARPLRTADDFDVLLDEMGAARIVCLGEASHGTSEYYVWRAALTRRLVSERGFSFVAVEGDWPDCFSLNRWVKSRDATRRTRAIGVVYRPGSDAFGNRVPTVMGRRYDALCSFDETHALRPLRWDGADSAEELETNPTGR